LRNLNLALTVRQQKAAILLIVEHIAHDAALLPYRTINQEC